jgi:hypothetical protein
MQKIGINRDHFENKFTAAGTHWERKILESLGVPMEFDRQIIIEDLRLRVNLDGDNGRKIYECKTYGFDKGFKMPKKYIQQVQVQMFASALREAEIVSYGLIEEEYDNYFLPVDKDRRQEHPIPYDEKWINGVYLPKLRYLAECLKEGRFP